VCVACFGLCELILFPRTVWVPQDGLDKIIMNNKLGGADPHVDDKERTRNIRVIDTMKGAKEYTKYFGVL
jgi:hypothetical protein